jgi:outer membrane protein OmpA-like peptidoglycan-associated protein
MIALGALGFLAWRELPNLKRWRDRILPPAKHAAGEVVAGEMPRHGRVSNLRQFVVQYSTTVVFARGSVSLTRSATRSLDKVVDKGDTLPGYLIEVAGFADTAGSREFNGRLEAARADAVIAYLARVRSVPLEHIVNATGLDGPSAFEANPPVIGTARATDRRVEVRVVMRRAASSVR